MVKKYVKPKIEFLAESRKIMTVQLTSCGTVCVDTSGQCPCQCMLG